MLQLVITRGLPGCGKSTRALAWVRADPKRRARVCRDVLREHVFGLSMAPGEQVMDRAGEAAVTGLQEVMVQHLLAGGYSVVVDDTCLPDGRLDRWAFFARLAGVNLELWDLRPGMPEGVTVEECIARDAARAASGGRSVGADVIRSIARHGAATWQED